MISKNQLKYVRQLEQKKWRKREGAFSDRSYYSMNSRATEGQITLFDVGSGEYQEKANLALNNNEINLLWTAAWEDTIGTKQFHSQKNIAVLAIIQTISPNDCTILIL